jgi:HAD superfamily hydrolase (TIGR01509 family)
MSLLQINEKSKRIYYPASSMAPTEPKIYKNIIFDLGAVLLSFNLKEIVLGVFKDHQPPPLYLMDALKHEIWLNVDRGLLTYDQAVELLHPTFDKNQLQKLFHGVPNYLAPMPEGLELFYAAKRKGYGVYILSNMSDPCYQKIKSYDFLKAAHGAIYSYQVKYAKPDREIYQLLLDTYQLKPEECLFIDDLEKNIIGGQALGIDGILCSDHTLVRQQLRTLNVLD